MPVRAKAGENAKPSPFATAAPRLHDREFVETLEMRSRAIRDPVAKLRYIRNSLARYEQADRAVKVVPWSPLRRLLYRLLSAAGLREMMRARGLSLPDSIEAGARRDIRLARLALAAGLFAVIGGLAAGGYALSRATSPPPVASVAAKLSPVAEPLPALPKGVTPAAVWTVETGESWEQYSNGLRIDTSYAVASDPRRYRVFDAGRGMLDETFDKPVGILFHTSESDIWPLDEAYNENLRKSSHDLLKYLNRNKVYHYLIDRFGRVFRVVGEEGKANHAGQAVWTRDNLVYMSLNHSFLGLCFETRWEGGRALPITQAQLAAGRNLTELLRQRYDITADMCVGHGLASVNAKKHLIGHHVDWARGFPFEAFGLPNQYARVAPSVAIFGFTYDDEFLKKMNEPWPGVQEAERVLTAAATDQGKTIEEIRQERQGLFDRWLAEQTKDQEEFALAQPAAGRGPERQASRPAARPAPGFQRAAARTTGVEARGGGAGRN
jgi:hypothetical protein